MCDDARPPSTTRRPAAPWTSGRGLSIAIALLSAFSAGAARTREASVQNAARDGADRVASSLGVGACARGNLATRAPRGGPGRPGGRRLAAGGGARIAPGGEPGGPLALAELWYRAALRRPHHDPASALPLLRAAAAAAALALAGPDAGCCDCAIEVHNDAVARLVRISQDERVSGARAGRWPWPGSGSWRRGRFWASSSRASESSRPPSSKASPAERRRPAAGQRFGLFFGVSKRCRPLPVDRRAVRPAVERKRQDGGGLLAVVAAGGVTQLMRVNWIIRLDVRAERIAIVDVEPVIAVPDPHRRPLAACGRGRSRR